MNFDDIAECSNCGLLEGDDELKDLCGLLLCKRCLKRIIAKVLKEYAPKPK